MFVSFNAAILLTITKVIQVKILIVGAGGYLENYYVNS